MDITELAEDIAYDITGGGLHTAEFVGGSSQVGLIEVTSYVGKKYLMQVSELEEI